MIEIMIKIMHMIIPVLLTTLVHTNVVIITSNIILNKLYTYLVHIQTKARLLNYTLYFKLILHQKVLKQRDKSRNR